MLFVQIPSGLRTEWGLKTNPDLVGKQVNVTGNLELFHLKSGMKSVTSISFTGDQPAPEPVEVISITEARAKAVGETVSVTGTVTAKLKNSITIQDGEAGVAVRPTSLAVDLGDEITVVGKVAQYRGLTQIDGARLLEKTAGTVPEAKVVEGSAVGEEFESQLITLTNVSLTDKEQGTGWANFAATSGTNFVIRDENDNLGLQAGMTYDSITGIVQQFDDVYQLIPRDANDVVEDVNAVKPVVASPSSGTFIENVSVTLSTGTADTTIYYTVDGTDPTAESTKYTTPIEFTEDTQLKAIAITSDERESVIQTYDYVITDALRIHDIQGSGHVSPLEGQVVEEVKGIVTYKFVLQGTTYYHIQTPDNERDGNLDTSEAIVLYSGRDAWNLSVGNLVKVKGKVSEYAIDGYADRQTTDLKTTQINVRNDQGGVVEVIEESVPLPKPYIIDESNLPTQAILSEGLSEFDIEKYAGDFWESREAMLVQVGDVKSVGPQQHGDLTTVLASRETETKNGGVLLKKDQPTADLVQFRLEPNTQARNFEVATGDKFTGPIVGVVGYSFQNYKIYVDYNEMQEKFVKGEAVPETTTIVKNPNKLTIGSYNLENFSNNKKTTSDDKAQKLARAIANDMHNPDIVGVTEVQDNNGPDAGGPEANESYQRLIDAITAAGGVTYKYANIDPVNNEDGGQPNANIRVGFLYNPERVSLKKAPHGDAMTPVGYENDRLTVNPGRIDPANEAFNRSRKPVAAEFTFQGEDVIVIGNHWNSKGGDTPLFGAIQPPVYKSEIQRKKIAQIVHDFIADVKEKNPYANVVALGDFNDFQFAESLEILEGDIMKNLVKKVPENDRYSYVYQGNSQVLDHVLVSNNMFEEAEIDMLHVNADYTDMAGRASDHDPVLVQVALEKAPIKIDNYYTFKSFKTTRLLINKPSVSVYLDGESIIRQEVVFTGNYAKFHGEGFAQTTVRLKPAKAGAIIDFAGTNVKTVIIDSKNVKEIRGAENIGEIQYRNGASVNTVTIVDRNGEPLQVPLFLSEII
ncbi:endonuclease/exonuclease/phosphatase [Sporosarcina sp. PTS2304]|nr:endonuclease/exonuclease/phosphatase [Sporosarcina sp. PTS2304]